MSGPRDRDRQSPTFRYPTIEALPLRLDDRLYLDHLAQQIVRDEVVLFVGAGLSKNAVRRDGSGSQAPTWWQLATQLRGRLGARMQNENDVLKIADYFEAKYGRASLLESIGQALQDDDHLPGRVHELIVQLNFREIITTNFDTLIERTCRQIHVSPQVIIDDRELVRSRRHPRIVKMNGCVTKPSTIVLTGNDFLAYSSDHPLIEAFVLKCFVESTVLFVGFSLDDPTFRIINEKMLRTLGTAARKAYALHLDVSQEQRKHWSSRNVELIDIAVDPLETCIEAAGQSPPRPPYETLLWTTLQALVEARRSQFDKRSAGQLSASNESPRASSTLWRLIRRLGTKDPQERADGMTEYLGLWDEPRSTVEALDNGEIDRALEALVFITLFWPLPSIFELVDFWLINLDERRTLRADTDAGPTMPDGPGYTGGSSLPEEFRIPLLGFCGLTDRYRVLVERAADSLWARQLEHAAASATEDRLAVARRFFNLMNVAPNRLQDWPAYEFQLMRLDGVLRDLVLAPATSLTRPVDCLLEDLIQGWVFGDSPPESLSACWKQAQSDVYGPDPSPDSVPWELLIVLALVIDGEDLVHYRRMLTAAWHRSEIDLGFLVGYVQRRLQIGDQQSWSLMALDQANTSQQNPLRRHEAHLATFIRWLCDLAAGDDPAASPDRRDLADLAPSIYAWLSARKDDTQLREAIASAYGAVLRLADASAPSDDQCDDQRPHWAKTELPAGLGGLRELKALWHDAPMDPVAIRAGFDRLRKIETQDSRDVEPIVWFLDACELAKKTTPKQLGRVLASLLITNESRLWPKWKKLIARIQEHEALRDAVEAELEKRSSSSTLFAFLRPALEQHLDQLDDNKVQTLRGELLPFVEHLDDAILDRVLVEIDPADDISRDSTAAFLAALIRRAPAPLRAAHRQAWLRDLERLIAHGATCEGDLREVVADLSATAVDQLQSNLVAAVLRHGRLHHDGKPVGWIVETLCAAPTQELSALEEGLIGLVTSPVVEIAEASLAGILGPIRSHRPTFLERHRQRLGQARRIASATGGFRTTSCFAKRLDELRQVTD